MKSIIRWAGSKRQLLSTLRKHVPSIEGRYIEPFCGSACLFFDLNPTKAVLGDLNEELIETYRSVRFFPGHVVEGLKRLKADKQTYYKIRDQDPELLSPVERATRFLYLNKLCFNGLYRTNRSGRFNVPYAPPRGKWKYDFEAIVNAATQLEGATLVCGDFGKTLDSAKSGDFVYVDPPYIAKNRRIFSEYYSGSFGFSDLPRLIDKLNVLEKRGVKCLLSYTDCKEIRNLLPDWTFKRVWAKRHIAGFAGDRRGAYEILAWNPNPN